jgi:predicted phosphoribosyltransferase
MYDLQVTTVPSLAVVRGLGQTNVKKLRIGAVRSGRHKVVQTVRTVTVLQNDPLKRIELETCRSRFFDSNSEISLTDNSIVILIYLPRFHFTYHLRIETVACISLISCRI